MDIIKLMDNKALRPLEKREEIAEAIRVNLITILEIQALKAVLDGKKMALILEAMEAVSKENPAIVSLEWVHFTQDFILSKSNSLKREASRIIGNIAHLFPGDLDDSIPRLLENMKDPGTVVRWGSAYALARILSLPQYAKSELYDILVNLSELEQNNGVRNQLLGGLKKADKLRK